MKHNITQTAKTIILTVILAAGLQFVFAATWTSAPANPPQGNVEPPINEDRFQQYKKGSLLLNTGWTENGQTVKAPIGLQAWGTSIFHDGIKLPTGAGDGLVLTSDPDGDASWETIEAVVTAAAGGMAIVSSGNVGTADTNLGAADLVILSGNHSGGTDGIEPASGFVYKIGSTYTLRIHTGETKTLTATSQCIGSGSTAICAWVSGSDIHMTRGSAVNLPYVALAAGGEGGGGTSAVVRIAPTLIFSRGGYPSPGSADYPDEYEQTAVCTNIDSYVTVNYPAGVPQNATGIVVKAWAGSNGGSAGTPGQTPIVTLRAKQSNVPEDLLVTAIDGSTQDSAAEADTNTVIFPVSPDRTIQFKAGMTQGNCASYGGVRVFVVGYLTGELTGAGGTVSEGPYANFGGMYGSGSGSYTNPLAGNTKACPAGYGSYPIIGTIDVDHQINVCVGDPNTTTPVAAFGGVWSSNYNNPVTNSRVSPNQCPSGFTGKDVMGYADLDWGFGFCYSTNVNASGAVKFGGLYGNTEIADGDIMGNPLLGGFIKGCPLNYTAVKVYGYTGPFTDKEIWVCHER